MSQKLFRYVCDDKGIYEAISAQCPETDSRREYKPDGSWLAKVGEKFPNAISFWTEQGHEKYLNSGLKDWHSSVLQGQLKLQLGLRPSQILYEDDLQVICYPNEIEIVREYPFSYAGPIPPVAKPVDHRPAFIRHHSSLRDWSLYASYSGSSETFSIVSSVGADLGLERIAIHHEILNPGHRTSWPHSHKLEEELVYILKGQPHLWLNGRVYPCKQGDLLFFPPETNLAHTLINQTDQDIEILVLGEQDIQKDKVYYPLHPARNEECKQTDLLWESPPQVTLHSHDGLPTTPCQHIETSPYKFQRNQQDVDFEVAEGDSPQSLIRYSQKSLSRLLGAKNVALNYCQLEPGFRSSYPHAEKTEEEFLYILSGSGHIWVNGHLHTVTEGDSICFPAGTGLLHTLINNDQEPLTYLAMGETSKEDNQCAFYEAPQDYIDQCGDFYWADAPKQDISDGTALPIQP